MVRRQGRKWFSVCMSAVLMALAARAPGQVLSLKAVAINAEPIEPTNNVQANPGDIIECEIYGSNWSSDYVLEQRLRAWQVTVDGREFGAGLPVMPAYWDDPDETTVCYTAADCDAGEICWISEGIRGFCTGPDHHPEDGAYIDCLRPDYVFAGAGCPPPAFPPQGVDISTLNYRYAVTLLQVVAAPLYTPPPKYFGTLALEVLPNACGTFTVEFLGETMTFFMSVGYIVSTPDLVGLEIDAGECSYGSILSSYPPDCAIDARQPSMPNGSRQTGWDSMVFSFEGPSDPCTLGPSDFSVREVPPGRTTLAITDVTCGDGWVTVILNWRILLEAWTCLRFHPTGEEFCMAHLPGDVNGNGSAEPADILRVIDCLNGIASCREWQCDVDRSGQCGPPDILRVIDLLNGAGVYESWLNRSLPSPCPSEL